MTARSAILRSVDDALERADVRAAFEEYKRLVAVATALPIPSEAHVHAMIVAEIQAHRVVGVVDPDGALPGEVVYRRLVNVAMDEMLPDHSGGVAKPSFVIKLPAGRMRGSRDKARRQLIGEVRAGNLTDDQIITRGRELAPERWPIVEAHDPMARDAERHRVDDIWRHARDPRRT
jgi:hypothetical protein